MSVILLLVGFILLVIGLFYFVKLGFKLSRAFFVWTKLSLSSEKKVDDVYMNKVLSKSEEYKDHVKQTDKIIEDLVN